MDLTLCAPDYIRSISPYIPGKPISELAREMGIAEEKIVKLASNENPLGMSPKAHAAAQAALQELARYPDGSGFELKSAISAKIGIPAEQIVLGAGSNELLDLTARTFLHAGTSAVYSQHAFAVYPIATHTSGATGISTPAKNFGHDLDAMLAAIRPDTRVVFIANPNNPTGNYLGADELQNFLQKCPDNVIVVLDEAYNEYLAPAQRYNSVPWIAQHPNLLITRTFSKIYGLAGLRVGYAVTSAGIADLFNRVRAPFNINSVALAAAQAALNDTDFLRQSYQLNEQGLRQLEAGFAKLGCEHIPSSGNFITVKVGDAAHINQRLLEQGVIVRPIAGYGMPQWLRITIGTQAENARFLEALEVALK